jgi:tetratricopeptide (TPR) repeat protein
MRRLFQWFGIGKLHVEPSVSAHSAVAAGRDIRDSVISVGLDEKGVVGALERDRLEEAVAGYRARLISLKQELQPVGQSSRMLDLMPREADPELRELLARAYKAKMLRDWADTQTSLGEALLQLASGAPNERMLLEKAVAAFREALNVFEPETEPWAINQYQLATALTKIGTEQRDEAIAAFRAALKVWTLVGTPNQWAMTQGQLGIALVQSSDVSETTRLQEAVVALRETLKVWTRQSAPTQWAIAQWTLGLALELLGQEPHETAGLDEAAAAYWAALEEITDPDTRKLINDNLVRVVGLLKHRRNRGCGGETLKAGG